MMLALRMRSRYSTVNHRLISTACTFQTKVIWRQAMQYHNMLKQKEEQAKQAAIAQQKALAEKNRIEGEKQAAEKAKYDAVKAKVDAEKARIQNAEKTAEELAKQEAREKDSKNAFKGVKKGFLG